MKFNKLINRLLDQFTFNDAGNVCFSSKAIMSNNKYYLALSEAVHENGWSYEYALSAIHEVLEYISDSNYECIDDIHDRLHDVLDSMSLIYTSDLTEWLNASNYHVYYLDDVYDCDQGGFNMLQQAYEFYCMEVINEVISLIQELEEE